jgi:hypothetical protein
MQERAQTGTRAFRGLALVFALTFVNLFGVTVTLAAFGGPEPWTAWQFVGAFGAIEAASGLANVITPNIWRLPGAELRTRSDVKLAGTAMLLPHWGGLARAAAGLVCLTLAAWHEGLGPTSSWLAVLVLLLAWLVVGISAVLARAGVARPDLDVVQFVMRWGGREQETPPISIGASVFQFLLGVATIPAVKLLPPSVLYRPELAPSPVMLLATFAASVFVLGLVYVLWRGRIDWSAPAEQQREAEKHA